MMTCCKCGVRLKCGCNFDLKAKPINGRYPCKKCAGKAEYETEFWITLSQKAQNVNTDYNSEQD